MRLRHHSTLRQGLIAAVVIALALAGATAAKEIPRQIYSEPIGLTELDGLRVVIAPAPIRLDTSELFCQAEGKLENG